MAQPLLTLTYMNALRPTHLVLAVIGTFSLLGVEACSSDEPTEDPAVDAPEVNGTADCNISGVLCERTPPQCPEGKTATKQGDCYGPCVAIAQCKPGSF